jgi:hypothetical protein
VLNVNDVESEEEFCAAREPFQFQGFPSVGIMMNDKVIVRHQGLISAESLKTLIQSAVN